MGGVVADRKAFSNKIKSGLLVTFLIYAACSTAVIIFINNLLEFMAVSPDLIPESAVYIRIECIANVFGILF